MTRGVTDKWAALIQAAIDVIAAVGYDRARIADIAAAAGVAAGTTYLYFKSKPDLLVAVFRERLGQSRALFRAGTEDPSLPPEQRLRHFVFGHLDFLAADPRLATLTQIEVRQSDPAIRRQIAAVMEEHYFAPLEALIRDGQARGAFRPDLDFRLIRNMVFGALDQTVTAWVLSGQKWDLTAQAAPLFQLLLAGIGPAGAPQPTPVMGGSTDDGIR